MRFLVPIAEFDFITSKKDNEADNPNIISANTSVNNLKAHFFETLGEIGEIIKIEKDVEQEILKELCLQSDTIMACFHELQPDNIACRLLMHSKGSLMVSGGFLDKWSFNKNTLNIVTTHKQAEQLKNKLGIAAPFLGVFTPSLQTDLFRLPSEMEIKEAKIKYSVKENYFNIVYAGRLISNKGIAQLVKSLNLFPCPNIQLSIVGDFEPDFYIYQCNASHATFPQYFEKEIIGNNNHIHIVRYSSLQHKDLRQLFWSADCFVYPSFHEDENFGITPREAMLCGVPTVVTDFCGLGALGNAKIGLIKTYPTLGGIRFCLQQLSAEISKIVQWSITDKKQNRNFNYEWVLQECNTDESAKALKTAADKLLKIPIGDTSTGGWRSKERFDKWMEIAPVNFKQAEKLAKVPYPDGLYVDGTGDVGTGWFSEPHFLTAIQSIYTTIPQIPKAIKRKAYRGFWRIGIWEQEKAIVEFGFPGPRIKRFNDQEFTELMSIMQLLNRKEPVFYPSSPLSLALVEQLMELGFLVPDEVSIF